MIQKLILKNRSYRKFHTNETVDIDTLTALIALARLTPSSKNRQPLKYLLINNKADTDFVFEHLRWAWYLKDWNGPTEDEKPPAYIIMLLDTRINDMGLIDAGIAAQTILLGAVEKNLGGCIIRTVNRYEVKNHFDLADHLQIVQVIAIGKPKQEVKITTVRENGKIEYFEDKENIHWVPKRSLDEIILPNKI